MKRSIDREGLGESRTGTRQITMSRGAYLAEQRENESRTFFSFQFALTCFTAKK